MNPQYPFFITMISSCIYWALFGAAVIGLVGLFFSFSRRSLCLLVIGFAAVIPYCGVWLIDYGHNRLIRTVTAVDVELVSKNELMDGRRVVLQLKPQVHTFYNEPNSLEFSIFGSIDDTPVKVISINSTRGIDQLIKTIDVEVYVPHVGASSIRLDAISFGDRRYIAKSDVLELGHHYAYE